MRYFTKLEMITYLGMTMPMAVFALVSWLKNPFEGKRSEVKVNDLYGFWNWRRMKKRQQKRLAIRNDICYDTHTL